MPRLKAANFASTALVSNIDAITTSFVVADASKFPDAPFRITVDAEIMEVGAIDKVNNVFSNIQRGLEGTTATRHTVGAIVENRWTAGTYNELLGASDFDAHLAGNMPHRATDPSTGKVYRWGLAIQNGKWGILYEEVV